jgi:hypothetical protein
MLGPYPARATRTPPGEEPRRHVRWECTRVSGGSPPAVARWWRRREGGGGAALGFAQVARAGGTRARDIPVCIPFFTIAILEDNFHLVKNHNCSRCLRRPIATAAATMLHLASYPLYTDRTLHDAL